MHFKIRVQIDDGEYKSMHYDPQTKHVNVLLKEFKQQKWPSRSLKVIGNVAIW